MNIEEQKLRLIESKQDLEKELSNLGRKLSDSGDWIVVPDKGDGTHADPIDNADITEDFEEKIAVLRVLEERYTQINKALSAIDSGSYGVCANGGEKISEERLLANPSATTCVEHAR